MSDMKRDLLSAILWLGASVVWFTMGSQKNQPILIGVGGLSIMVGMEYLRRWWNARKKENEEKNQNSKNSQESKSNQTHKKKKK